MVTKNGIPGIGMPSPQTFELLILSISAVRSLQGFLYITLCFRKQRVCIRTKVVFSRGDRALRDAFDGRIGAATMTAWILERSGQ